MSDVTIDVWYGEKQSLLYVAQRWMNILGRISPIDEVETLAYRLNESEPKQISWGADLRRLAGRGDFNIELDAQALSVGDNPIDIIVEMNNGKTHTKTLIIQKQKTTPQLPFAVQWDRHQSILDIGQVTDGRWRIGNSQVWVEESGYDRAIALGDIQWANYQVTVPITIYGFSASGTNPMSGGYGVGMALYWQGHVDWEVDEYSADQPRFGYEPIGGMAWYGWDKEYGFQLRLEGHDASSTLALDVKGFQADFGETFYLKFSVQNQPESSNYYKLKAWSATATEPDTWNAVAYGSEGELSHGSVLLLAHHTVCSFGDVLIESTADERLSNELV